MSRYIGVDVSKRQLDVDWQGKAQQFENNPTGIEKLLAQLKELHELSELSAVVLEPSGGYEAGVVNACHEHRLPVHVAHANKVRSYAKSRGILAKTDALDAAVLSAYGVSMNVPPDTIRLTETAREIKHLLGRREQLMKDRQREKNRLDKIQGTSIQTSIEAHIDWLSDAIKAIDKELNVFSKKTDVCPHYELLSSIPAVGPLVSYYLIAYLPELGSFNHKAIAALVGVAPYNRDSGHLRGKRFIQGGRSALRRILYMSAVASVRWNPDMKVFYERLRAAGKPAKLAFIAVIRKLLSVINSVVVRQTPWQPKLEKIT